MGKGLIHAVLLGFFLSGPSFGAAAIETASALEIDEINNSLRGKVAAIELVDGNTIRKAKKVVVESNFTYWRANGKEHKVASNDIVRITAKSKSRGWIGFGAGAGLGLLSAASTSSSASGAEGLVVAANADALFLSTVALAAIGYGVDKAIPRKSKTIFEMHSKTSLKGPANKAEKKRRAKPA